MTKTLVQNIALGGGVFNYLNIPSFCVLQFKDGISIPSFCVIKKENYL